MSEKIRTRDLSTTRAHQQWNIFQLCLTFGVECQQKQKLTEQNQNIGVITADTQGECVEHMCTMFR